MQQTTSPPKIAELKKTIEVNKTLNLLDINGSKKNFQSEFIVMAKDPTRKYLIAIVNQEDLDVGNLKFEASEENGRYARKVIYQENKLQNHYLAIKKTPDDTSPTPVICDVIIQLQELPAIELSRLPEGPVPDEPEGVESSLESSPLEKIDPEMKAELQREFSKLSKKSEETKNEEDGGGNPPVFTFGIICLVLFAVLISYKFLKR
jgi:hypothetical protein